MMACRIRRLGVGARGPRGTRVARQMPGVEPLEGRVLFAAGELDPAFAGDGVLEVADVNAGRPGGGAFALPGGKTLVSHASGGGGTDLRPVLTRYNPDGSLDATVGAGGRVTYDWGTGGSASGSVVRARPDGKLLLAGSAAGAEDDPDGPPDVVVGLMNPDGTFDTTFGGGDGRLVVDLPDTAGDFVHGISPAPGDKFVVGLSGSRGGFNLARFDAAGSLDPAFGDGGIVRLDVGPFQEFLGTFLVAEDGSIFAAGSRTLSDLYSGPDVQWESVLVKVRPDGAYDTNWGGGDGQVFGLPSILLQPAQGGKLVTAGHEAVARLNPDGSPDASFGGGDGVATRAGAPLRALRVAADGKIYTATVGSQTGQFGQFGDTHFVIERFAPDGAPDLTWAGDGTAEVNFHSRADGPNSIALHEDGDVVVVGQTEPGAPSQAFITTVIARFDNAGQLDPTFSGDGRITGEFESVLRSAGAVAVQPDGRTIVGGAQTAASDSPTGIGQEFFLARYRADGSADPTFGAGRGSVTTDFDGGSDQVNDVLVMRDGRILALGSTRAPEGPNGEQGDSDVALARYNADGALDTTFGGGDGKMTLEFGGDTYDTGIELALLDDGDIVLSASSGGHAAGQRALVRLNPDGTLDPALNGSGILHHDRSAGFALLPDGKILQADNDADDELYLTRLDPSGATDTTYGNGGRGPANGFGDPEESGVSGVDVILQGDKALVLAEGRFAHGNPVVVLFRFGANGAIDTTFGFGPNAGRGRAVYGLGDGFQAIPEAVTLDAAGRIVIGATAHVVKPSIDNSLPHLAVYRASTDGKPDESFGADGRRVLKAFAAGLADLALAPGNRPVLAGTYFEYDPTFGSRDGGIAVARFQSGEPVPPGNPDVPGNPGGPGNPDVPAEPDGADIAVLLDGGVAAIPGQTLDFGSVALAATAPERTFIIRNHGSAPLALEAIALPAGYVLLAGPAEPAALAPGAAATVRIALSTGTAGTFAGPVIVASDDPDESPFALNLSGVVTPTTVVLEPSPLEVSAVTARVPPAVVAGDRRARGSVAFTMTNATAAPVADLVTFAVLASADEQPGASDAQLVSVTRPVRLRAGASRTVRLNFGFPAGTPEGEHQLLVTATAGAAGTGGGATAAAAGPRVEVRAPFVRLAGLPGGAARGPLSFGRRATFVVPLQNAGNVATARTPATYTLIVSRDGTEAGEVFHTTATGRISLKPNAARPQRVAATFPAGAIAPGSYTLLVRLTAHLNEANDQTVAMIPFSIE